jgi:uncharacterized membrane protein
VTRSNQVLLLATGIGAITGIRSMAATAVVSLHLRRHTARLAAGPARLLASNIAAGALTVAAAGEAAADKVPVVPARTEPAPLIARSVIAAFVSAAVAQSRGTSVASAGAIGGAAALVSTIAVTNLRRFITGTLHAPDFLVGLAEDAVVLKGAALLAQALD